MITTSEFLRRAADVLEEDGWCQGRGTDGQGRHCAVGAMCSVAVDHGQATSVHLLPLRARLEGPLSDWNDEPGRTKEEVLALFRNTADELEVGESAERIANERELVS